MGEQEQRQLAILETDEWFRRAGFGEWDIDFSSAKPEAIRVMGKALRELYAPTEEEIYAICKEIYGEEHKFVAATKEYRRLTGSSLADSHKWLKDQDFYVEEVSGDVYKRKVSLRPSEKFWIDDNVQFVNVGGGVINND